MQLRNSFLIIFTCLLSLIFLSCEGDHLPKPASYLRLEYPKANYRKLTSDYPFSFEYSDQSIILKKRKKDWIDIHYPRLNATLVMTYNPVKNNLRRLLRDAEKLTFTHVIKADEIPSIPFENQEQKVYGRVFEVVGNAATQIQFHATDSTNHFLTGALYFYAKPNYDSILPAVDYVRKDVVHLMETLEWNN